MRPLSTPHFIEATMLPKDSAAYRHPSGKWVCKRTDDNNSATLQWNEAVRTPWTGKWLTMIVILRIGIVPTRDRTLSHENLISIDTEIFSCWGWHVLESDDIDDRWPSHVPHYNGSICTRRLPLGSCMLCIDDACISTNCFLKVHQSE